MIEFSYAPRPAKQRQTRSAFKWWLMAWFPKVNENFLSSLAGVIDALMVADVIVMLDEEANLAFEITG